MLPESLAKMCEYSQHMPTTSSVSPSLCTLMLTVIWSSSVRCVCSCVTLNSPNSGPDDRSPLSDVSIHALCNEHEYVVYFSVFTTHKIKPCRHITQNLKKNCLKIIFSIIYLEWLILNINNKYFNHVTTVIHCIWTQNNNNNINPNK